MRRAHDELEERRVMRLLDGAAADAPELAPAEVARLLERARGRRSTTRRPAMAALRARVLAPVAAAAALAAVVLAGGTLSGADRDERPATATRGVVVFPEASALELLLEHRRGGAT